MPAEQAMPAEGAMPGDEAVPTKRATSTGSATLSSTRRVPADGDGRERGPAPRRGRARRLWRRLHRWVGLGILVLVSSLAVTGILLNHPGLLGGERERILTEAVDPTDPDRVFRGTVSGLHVSDDGGTSWREVPMLFPPDHVAAIGFAPDAPTTVYAISRDWGVVRSTDGGWVWEEVSLGFQPAGEGLRLTGLAVGPRGVLRLTTTRGVFVSDDAGASWARRGGIDAGGRDLRDIVHDLHTGYLVADWFPLVHDAAAIGLLFLGVSGLVIWKRRNGRRTTGEAVPR